MPRQEGVLLLEHARDPARSLLLRVQPERPIAESFARDVAARLGVALRRSV